MKENIFDYQMSLIKLEIESVNQIIARMDNITQSTKNWAVITWAGSIALALKQADLHQYIGLTCVLPLLFWFIDGHWRSLQRRSIFRIQKISKFLNSSDFKASYDKGQLNNFKLLDPVSKDDKNDPAYKNAIAVRKTLLYPEVAIFYTVPFFFSILLHFLLLFSNANSTNG